MTNFKICPFMTAATEVLKDEYIKCWKEECGLWDDSGNRQCCGLIQRETIVRLSDE